MGAKIRQKKLKNQQFDFHSKFFMAKISILHLTVSALFLKTYCPIMGTNLPLKAVFWSEIFIIITSSCMGKFQNYLPETKTTEKHIVFSDTNLTQTFFKANLICNACNGYLVSQNVNCSHRIKPHRFTCPDVSNLQGEISGILEFSTGSMKVTIKV